jgi:predicted  nucleic acid-binding Zn-ribbon protein
MDVGSDIDSQCSKCGVTTHVVVAMVGTEIAKCECPTCGGVHKFRDPSRKPATKRKTASKAAPTGPAVEPDLSLPVRAYQTSDTYQLGERIEHSVFGAGVIEQVMPAKVRVFFPDGQKVLLHGKAL